MGEHDERQIPAWSFEVEAGSFSPMFRSDSRVGMSFRSTSMKIGAASTSISLPAGVRAMALSRIRRSGASTGTMAEVVKGNVAEPWNRFSGVCPTTTTDETSVPAGDVTVMATVLPGCTMVPSLGDEICNRAACE